MPPLLTRRAVTAGLAVTVAAWTQSAGAKAPAEEPTTWTAAPMKMRLRPDANDEAELWAFNQRVPGPALRVRQGEDVRLRLVNETPKPLALHWQGVRGPNAMDGVGGLTQDPVAPGRSFEYRFVPPDAGTFLIRPCVIGGSAEPTERGLTSLLIVDEATPVPVDGDLAVLIDDWLLEQDGSLSPFEAAHSGSVGRLGNWLSVNGRGVPETIEMLPGSRLRLRLANASNARAMRLRFEGLKPYVAAIDGQPTDAFEPLKASLPFAPGTRYDVLLDLPRTAGASGDIVAMVGTGVPLLRLVTKGEERASKGPLAPLPPNAKLPPAIKLQGAVRKDVVIGSDPASGSAPPTINGQAGSPSMPPLMSVKRGTPVVLALVNRTPTAQPLHLHGHVFRLLHPYDDGWDPYFLDTLLVPENRTVRIAFVADNPGRWLLASMILERFDAGLWTWIEVT